MTRKHVTVALSGDGGDEVFAGYNRYGQGLALAKMIRALPKPMRRAMAGAMTAVKPGTWDSLAIVLPSQMRPRLLGDKFHKLAGVLPEDAIGFYRHLVTQWPEASSLVRTASAPDESLYAEAVKKRFPDDVSWMQYLDTLTYLPDDILTKVDRASMAVALEVRVPLLDHRVVELSWRLPQRLKLRGGTGKWLLRQIAYKYVPKGLLERPKMGFAIPIDQWLRGPLKDWAENLLGSLAGNDGGMIDAAPIAEKWAEHQSGARNWQYFLWNVLMYEAWRRSNAVAQPRSQSFVVA
jgi:asparagine synthase (glutamine-hydrolysing)